MKYKNIVVGMTALTLLMVIALPKGATGLIAALPASERSVDLPMETPDSDEFTVILGQSKTFTVYNIHNTEKKVAPIHPGQGQPTILDATSDGNKASTRVLAQAYQEGQADAWVGVNFSVEESKGGIQAMEAKISLTLSYTLDVDFNVLPPSQYGGGSADALIEASMPNSWEEDIEHIYFVHYSNRDRRSGQVTLTRTLSLVAGNEYEVATHLFAYGDVYIGNQADSYAEVTVEEIKVSFIPVLLVHGYCSGEEMWGPEGGTHDFKKALEDQGFLVETIDLIPKPTNDSILNYGSQLFGKIDQIKKDYNTDQVDIVAHSLGGLAARAYAWQNSQRRDVRTLIMLGTPNNGTDLLKYWPFLRSVLRAYGLSSWVCQGDGKAAEQMTPGSPFLRDLNNAGRQPSIENYYTIAGSDEIPLLSLVLEWPNDGVVEVSSVHSLSYATHIEAPVNHFEYDDDSYVLDSIVQILRGTISSAALAVQVRQSNIDYQESALIEDSVRAGNKNHHPVPIDPTVSEMHFILASDGGELDFTLTSPGGTLITPTVAASDPLITYTNDITTLVGYDIVSPEQGNWTAHVAASETTSGDVNYAMLALLDSDLGLSILLDESVHAVNDPVPLTAQLVNASDPITGATVTAQVGGPDESIQTLSLYDDGSHGDAQASDGIYSNRYMSTIAAGVYEVTVTASGTISDEQFVRETTAMIWMEHGIHLPLVLKNYP